MMSESRTLRYGTIIAALAASVAALAASAQSYIAWSGRNDALKATILSVAVQQCSEITLASHNLLFHFQKASSPLEKGLPPESSLLDRSLLDQLQVKIVQAHNVLFSLDQKDQFDFLRPVTSLRDAGALFSNAMKPGKLPTSSDVKQLNDAILNFQSDISGMCMDWTRTHVFK
jgi:hypothetical protein